MAEQPVTACGSAHVFHAVDTAADAVRAAADFFGRGPDCRDDLVFFGDDALAARLTFEMERAAPARTRRFRLVRPDDLFGAGAPEAIGALLRFRDAVLADAIARDGQVRFVVAPSSGSPDCELWDRAESFECMFTGRPHPAMTRLCALCLYDRTRYPRDLLELAAAAHPCSFRNGVVVPTSGFVAPRAERASIFGVGRVA